MRELFIYYRIRSHQAAQAGQAVASFQARLMQDHPRLRARCLRRPDAKDGLQTWMETYSTDPMTDPEGVSPTLQVEIEALAVVELHGLIDGPRHVEVFVTCAS